MNIGPYTLDNRVVLAPMAGVTDLPFRKLCKTLGAGLVVGEMVSSDPSLRNTRKSQWRLNHTDEPEPITVQIAGGDPESLANAARFNVANGAQIIDINMGCPAKKVCNKAAGSALLKDEALVNDILHAVVDAVDVPVTLKMRTGWDTQHRNAPKIAELAEQAGIVSLAVHGRTRACGYKDTVEYDTIATVKQHANIPVFANGDITDPIKAAEVLNHTSADGVLIGRAAQGNPWIFKQITHYLETGELLTQPSIADVKHTLLTHIHALHDFYGDFMGVRIARKHVGWYLKQQPDARPFMRTFNAIDDTQQQLDSIEQLFKNITTLRGLAA